MPFGKNKKLVRINREYDGDEPGNTNPGFIGWGDLKDIIFLIKCLVSEFLGTFYLVFIGCGSCVPVEPPRNVLLIGLTFGLIIASAVNGLGNISGCHINPAVTVGLFIAGRISLIKGLLYIPAQCLGAVTGAAILKMATSPESIGPTTITDISPGQGMMIEGIITSLLILVVCAVTDPLLACSVAPLAIGCAITCCHLFAIPFTGSSMNPARTFGSAVIEDKWFDHWIYWVGPIAGGAIAGLLYRFILT